MFKLWRLVLHFKKEKKKTPEGKSRKIFYKDWEYESQNVKDGDGWAKNILHIKNKETCVIQ
jgi:hypothetical protein